MSSKEGITEIFHNMNYGDNSGGGSVFFNKSNPAYSDEFMKKITNKPKSIIDAIDSTRSALPGWRKLHALEKFNLFHKVEKNLVDALDTEPGLKPDLSCIVDYFNFNSDVLALVDRVSGKATDVVVILLPPQDYCFLLGATVSAALAAGCGIVVHTTQTTVPLFLQGILSDSGLPDGIFNVVSESFTSDNLIVSVGKIICSDSSSVVQSFPFRGIQCFNFFCLYKTAAIVLESCDLNAAVGEIFHKTWERPSLWEVSIAVVQESIWPEFSDKLRSQMEQFHRTKSGWRSEEMSEKINEVILKAAKAGAEVLKVPFEENEWGPTALVHYQGQDDVPVLKVLVCRTPKEGVKLLNNFPNVLGTSIWSELSAQGLEVASQLRCSNVWINCHGVTDARVPLSLTGSNGNMTVGGRSGILEYLSSFNIEYFSCESGKVSGEAAISKTVLSAEKALDSWQSDKTRRKYFPALAEYLKSRTSLSNPAGVFADLACQANAPTVLEKNSTEEFFVLYEEVPVGVLGLVIPSETDDEELVRLVALPVMLGNAVILVMEKENSFVTSLVGFFNGKFPKNLVNVVFGADAAIFLASMPNVEALWLYRRTFIPLLDILRVLSRNSKHLWIIPESARFCQELTGKECVRRKIVWLPKVEKFP